MQRRLSILVLLLVVPAARALPSYDEERTQKREHVTVRASHDADEVMVAMVGDICDLAAATYKEALPLSPPHEIIVGVSPSGTGHCATVTDRRSCIYVDYVSPERGRYQVCLDYMDPRQHGPVFVLCRAVAELFNPHRVPVLEQLLASCYGVPKVLEEFGGAAWLSPYEVDLRDGEQAFRNYANQPAVLAEHPRWAAAVAWRAVIEALGPDAFASLLEAAEGEGREALAAVRDAAVELDPALAQAFAAWDRATDLRPADDGSVLLASFESPEEARFWKHPFGVSVATSNAWATDGERCAELTYTGVGAWPRAIHYDPDWRFADWSRYRTLEFDVQNPGDALLELVMIAGDDESFGHAVVERWFQVPAGEEQHCVVPLTDLRAHHQWYQSVFFEGQARLDDIRTFQISAPRITAPTLVRLDNLRLVP